VNGVGGGAWAGIGQREMGGWEAIFSFIMINNISGGGNKFKKLSTNIFWNFESVKYESKTSITIIFNQSNF